MDRINIINNDVRFKFIDKKRLMVICKKIIKDYRYTLKSLNIILTSDSFLLKINKIYLKKNYFTDIISFNYSGEDKEIEGELYISVQRVKENAKKYSKSIDNELYRVIFHGILHLVGENDNNTDNTLKMKEKEDFYLNLCFT